MSSADEVVELLRENARYSLEDMARQTGEEPAEIAAIIDRLEADGTIRGYGAVLDHEKREQETVRAVVELNVTLDRETSYDDIASRIAKFPEVDALHLVSGEFDLLMHVEGTSLQAVSNFISNKVAPVPEITQTVTHYVMTTYKEQGIEFGDSDDDERLSISP